MPSRHGALPNRSPIRSGGGAWWKTPWGLSLQEPEFGGTHSHLWREGDQEVDYVVSRGRDVWAIEVKSGRGGKAGTGPFRNRYPKAGVARRRAGNPVGGIFQQTRGCVAGITTVGQNKKKTRTCEVALFQEAVC